MLRSSLVALVFLTLQAASYAQAPSPAQVLLERGLALLERNYYGFKPIDHAKLATDSALKLQRVCAGQSACPYSAGSSVLDETLASLGDGHSFRLNSNRYAQFNADASGAKLPMVGLKFGELPDAPALVVTRVREGSSAQALGLKRGDVVTAVDGRALSSFSSASEATAFITGLEFAAQPFTVQVSSQTTSASVAANGTTFTPSTTLERTITLTPEPLTPWLPSYALRADGIAVITFYQYLTNNQIAAKVHAFVRQAQAAGARAVILDVRGSGGGSAFESLASAGAFMDTVGVRFENKFGNGVNLFENGAITDTGFKIANPAKWTGPLLTLTNRVSRSAAEYMAYFLQRAGRARVLGEPTAGVLNTSTTVSPLPDGGAIAVTSGRSSTLSGDPHPERVAPDIVVTDDMAALSKGRDLVLERAVQSLMQP
jgi:carboxyl-terminal processing protease